MIEKTCLGRLILPLADFFVPRPPFFASQLRFRTSVSPKVEQLGLAAVPHKNQDRKGELPRQTRCAAQKGVVLDPELTNRTVVFLRAGGEHLSGCISDPALNTIIRPPVLKM